MISTVEFLGMRFLDANPSGVRAALCDALKGPFGYVVTPNVDHVVSYHRGDAGLRAAYDGAAFQICDSRVLAKLASLNGLHLTPFPGSDLTRELLEQPLHSGLRMAVIGPDEAAFRDLRARFPSVDLVHIPCAAQLGVGTGEWWQTVGRAAAADWDLLFVCLSFPKQELFARDLGRTGRERGLALCVGASIDFLTDRQTRAPKAMQRANLEWLHRLASDPRRMARRYLQRGPAIFGLAARAWRAERGRDRTSERRRVLVLSTVLPHGRSTGGEIASMNFIEGLRATGCEVDILAYRREGDDREPPPGFLSPRDWPIESAGRPVRAAAWMGRAYLARRPYSVQKYVGARIKRLLRLRLRTAPPDLVVVDHAQASWLLPLVPAHLPVVLIAHNVEHQLYGSHGDAVGGAGKASPKQRLKGAVYKREGERLSAVERAAALRAQEIWTLTDDDAAAFAQMAPGRVVRSFGVPGQAFRGACEPLPEPSVDVGLLGSWTWDVNRAGLDWFLKSVAPRLPKDLRITVAGRSDHAPGTVRSNVRFAGFVPDAGAFLRSCRVVAIPSTVGSGIQIKTIETLGLGVPTVATTVALRGIDDPPLDLRVANGATDMVSAILEALDAPRPDGRDGAVWRQAREHAFRTDLAHALDALFEEALLERPSHVASEAAGEKGSILEGPHVERSEDGTSTPTEQARLRMGAMRR
ncbi:WecB/TagA/CpsF family glycosyltransferase [Aureimonas ureilytica]|uniref:WecB/TagA/CpsF family glycosyltransferase n=1 Tax=Aureimonas ureilytica TaxID=401562 RepID=UPI0003677583|nr:WecB/TagA/CpsF family glycosyltransferase [Aureimonas ureilytica]